LARRILTAKYEPDAASDSRVGRSDKRNAEPEWWPASLTLTQKIKGPRLVRIRTALSGRLTAYLDSVSPLWWTADR
jgi:hypothetical protein